MRQCMPETGVTALHELGHFTLIAVLGQACWYDNAIRALGIVWHGIQCLFQHWHLPQQMINCQVFSMVCSAISGTS